LRALTACCISFKVAVGCELKHVANIHYDDMKIQIEEIIGKRKTKTGYTCTDADTVYLVIHSQIWVGSETLLHAAYSDIHKVRGFLMRTVLRR